MANDDLGVERLEGWRDETTGPFFLHMLSGDQGRLRQSKLLLDDVARNLSLRSAAAVWSRRPIAGSGSAAVTPGDSPVAAFASMIRRRQLPPWRSAFRPKSAAGRSGSFASGTAGDLSSAMRRCG